MKRMDDEQVLSSVRTMPSGGLTDQLGDSLRREFNADNGIAFLLGGRMHYAPMVVSPPELEAWQQLGDSGTSSLLIYLVRTAELSLRNRCDSVSKRKKAG